MGGTKMKLTITLAAMLAVAAANALAQTSSALKTVDNVDLSRYTGKWYEIAKYPNKFQKQCVGNTTATNTRKSANKIEVVNECLKKDGSLNAAKGEAKIVDNVTNSKLKVRFAPSFLWWLPAVWGDYWIIDLGPNYEYSVIGEPGREYFWILSRTPEMSDVTYQNILRRAEKMGFQPGKVVRTPQNVETLKGTTVPKS
jgi:apolipoprotein D and lipocalin family protein